jgi:hypothetical protein
VIEHVRRAAGLAMNQAGLFVGRILVPIDFRRIALRTPFRSGHVHQGPEGSARSAHPDAGLVKSGGGSSSALLDPLPFTAGEDGDPAAYRVARIGGSKPPTQVVASHHFS